MEFCINRSVLLKELSFLQNVVERKGTIPIIQNILISANEDGTLTLIGTDLEAAMKCICEAEIQTPGKLLLPARRLFDIVRNLPESKIIIKTDTQGHSLVLCEKSRFKLLSPPVEMFPDFPKVPASQYDIPSSIFRSIIPRVIFAATQEESRFALNGSQLILTEDGLRLVATDGHRLALIEKFGIKLGVTNEVKTLIPRKTLGEVLKLANEMEDESMTIGSDDNHIYFQAASRLFISRMLSGQFPNFEMILPKDNDKSIIFKLTGLASTLKRVAFMADEVTRSVKMHISNGQVEFTAQSNELGEALDIMLVDYTGPDCTVAFNVHYMLDFLTVAATEEVVFEFKDENIQLQLRPLGEEDFNYRYVVMPMRI